MAKIANTFTTSDATGNRESLSDVVSRISPEDTPVYSMIGKEGADARFEEWETEELDTPGSNIQAEGDEYSFGAVDPADRMGNYTQIFRKDWIVSASQDAVKNAGMAEQTKNVKLKKGIALRTDVEWAILSPNASVGGETRELGGLPTWYETNVSRGAGGANGGYNSGTKLTVAPTDGTQRAFTKTLLDATMQQAFTSGAKLSMASVSVYNKGVFVGFMSDSNVASFRYAVSSGGKTNTIVATADVYEGPFGKVLIVPNIVQSRDAALARNVHLLDKSMLKFKWLRKIQNDKDVAKTGDANKGVIIGEGTLKVANEAGLGVVADVFGLTAAS